jgi:Tat protein translocase TatB subunit
VPSIGPLEILVIAVVALIVFGPERLPEIARRVGKTASQLRDMAAEVKEEFQVGLDLDEDEREAPRHPAPSRPAAGNDAGGPAAEAGTGADGAGSITSERSSSDETG